MTDENHTLRAQLAVAQQQLTDLRAEKLAAELQHIRAKVALGSILQHFAAVAVAGGGAVLPVLDEAIRQARHTLACPPPSPFAEGFETSSEDRAGARAMVSDVIGHLAAIRTAAAEAIS